RVLIVAAETTGRAKATGTARPAKAAPAAAVLLDRFARRLPLGEVEPAVAVLVELFHQLALLTHRAAGAARRPETHHEIGKLEFLAFELVPLRLLLRRQDC